MVPLTNARFALNAANARWGSLYDALYGTDAISQDGELAPGKGYNAKARRAVIAFAREVAGPGRAAGQRLAQGRQPATCRSKTARCQPALKDPSQFKGYVGDARRRPRDPAGP